VVPGFKVKGRIKKIAASGGRRENFWGISCEKSRFYAKKSYFFPILGGNACWVRPPLNPPLDYASFCDFVYWILELSKQCSIFLILFVLFILRMYDNILNICHFRVVVSIFIAIMVIGTGYDILMIQLPKWQKEENGESITEVDETSHLINAKKSNENEPSMYNMFIYQ
jgi:hypothetical protein